MREKGGGKRATKALFYYSGNHCAMEEIPGKVRELSQGHGAEVRDRFRVQISVEIIPPFPLVSGEVGLARFTPGEAKSLLSPLTRTIFLFVFLGVGRA